MTRTSWNPSSANSRAILAKYSATELRALTKQLRRRKWREDPWACCQELLRYPDIGELHRDLLTFLQQRHKTACVLVPRGHLKTSVVTIGYSTNLLLNNPNLRILWASATWDNARAFLKEWQAKVTSDFFQTKEAVWRSAHWNQDAVTIATRTQALKQGSIETTGLDRNITGKHFDVIICDDLVNRENVTTALQRKKVIDYVDTLVPILEPTGCMIFVGTTWHQEDLYAHLKKNRPDVQWFVRTVEQDGQFVFPEKFNAEVLASIKARMDLGLFTSQYYLTATPPSDQVFKESWLQRWKDLPHGIVKTTVDLAVSQKDTACETAIVTSIFAPDKKLYVADVRHGRWSLSEITEQLEQVYHQWHPEAIGIEQVAQQQYFMDHLAWWGETRGIEFPIIGIPVHRAKSERVKALEPQFRFGNILLPPEDVDLTAQLLAVRQDMHGGLVDIVDALAHQLTLFELAEIEAIRPTFHQQHGTILDHPGDFAFAQSAMIWHTEAQKTIAADADPFWSEFGIDLGEDTLWR